MYLLGRVMIVPLCKKRSEIALTNPTKILDTDKITEYIKCTDQ